MKLLTGPDKTRLTGTCSINSVSHYYTYKKWVSLPIERLTLGNIVNFSIMRIVNRLFSTRRRLLHSLALSSVRGSTFPPLIESTLPAYYEDVLLSKYASRPALICLQERPRAHGGLSNSSRADFNLGRSDCLAWDYFELHEHVKATARGLIGIGVNKGDRIGVLMGNNRYEVLILSWRRCFVVNRL